MRSVTSSCRIVLSVLLVSLVSITLIPAFAAADEKKQVAIVTHKKSMIYNAAIDGLRSYLKSYDPKVDLHYFDFAKKGAIREIKQLSPDVIVTIGTSVTAKVANQIKNVPIVFSAVLGPVRFNLDKANITGSLLNIPVHDQFLEFKRLTTKVMKIGVLYNPKLNAEKIDNAQATAAELGIELSGLEVEEYNLVIPQLDDWLKSIDALWIIADNIICKPVNIQHLLLQTIKYRIPVLAFSPAIVKAGAVLSLAADYEDIGKQTAEIVIQVLEDATPGDISESIPRKYHLFINQAVAKKLGITIPADMLESAKAVYGR